MITRRDYIVLAIMAIICAAIVVGIYLFPWQAAYILTAIAFVLIVVLAVTFVAVLLGWGKHKEKENGTHT